MSVSVVIPHVPIRERNQTLVRAVTSVAWQTVPVQEMHICTDLLHEGPAATRTRGLMASRSDWTLYLDDDDFLDSSCVQRLLETAEETGADAVYPWFRVNNGTDPFPNFFGQPWKNDEPHIFPITYLIRTELAQEIGGFIDAEDANGRWAEQWDGVNGGEDWLAILALIERNAKIVHLPEILWTWEHGGSHFSGRTW